MRIPKTKSVIDLIKTLRSLNVELNSLKGKVAYLYKDNERLENLLKKGLEADERNLQEIIALHHEFNTVKQRAAEAEHIARNAISLKAKNTNRDVDTDTKHTLFADTHENDLFYLELENQFRGSEEEIADKQKRHIDLFKKSKVDFLKYPVLDIGSGRGEFLALLRDEGIDATGIDLNQQMVERMLEKGLKAVCDDAISYLGSLESSSVGAISGFHIAEHIPFDTLITLVAEAQRVLVPGGHLLLETPNPENLSVGSFTFHYDPSHLKPIPPAIMLFLAKFKGFTQAEILRFAPEVDTQTIKKSAKDTLLRQAYEKLYGPRDYALLAYK